MIRKHITSGKSIFTLESTKTTKHYTYSVKVDPSNKDRFYVFVLFGNENFNDDHYRFLGWFYNDRILKLQTKQSHLDPRVIFMDQFLFLLSTRDKLPTTCIFRPSCKCARCGRLLTTPKSITIGLGPKCSKF